MAEWWIVNTLDLKHMLVKSETKSETQNHGFVRHLARVGV